MKISIDNPCHENWDAMTPNEKGAFCLSCQKTVIDFSTKSIYEIKSFFQDLPLTEKVCGRFANDQLEAMTFDHFFKRFKRWNLLHKIAVICFFTFGMTLFSCTPNSSEQVIGKADYRRDTLQTQNTARPVDTPMTVGQPIVPPDTARKHPVKKVPAPSNERIQMIQGDVMVEPEPEIHTKGEVHMTIDDQRQVLQCASKDTLKGTESEKTIGKIKMTP